MMPIDTKNLSRDLLSSVVVFLVALPLCMGIAIASGAPPIAGIIAGVIGGIIVGALSGCPLQASGPAAGLAVIVFQLIQQFGFPTMCLITAIAGLIQFHAGIFRLGPVFRAVSPALIAGMLAGIGVLIFASQFHVMIDDQPTASGWLNILTIPQSTMKALFNTSDTPHHLAALIGLTTLISIIAWGTYRPRMLKAIPGALVGIAVSTGICFAFDLPIRYVELPENLMQQIHLPTWATFESVLTQSSILLAAVSVALVASAETLLCCTAVDQMHRGPKTRYNRELIAQGTGNFLSGLIGGLPITGVIVRSTANIEAGAASRLSTILHGIWLFAFVFFFARVLDHIPMAGLAAVLVYTGVRLVNLKELKDVVRHGTGEIFVYGVTVVGVVGFDLLTGVVSGFLLSAILTLRRLSALEIQIEPDGQEGHYKLTLSGTASFFNLHKLSVAFDSLPSGAVVDLRTDALIYIDHACMRAIESARHSKGLELCDLDKIRFKLNRITARA